MEVIETVDVAGLVENGFLDLDTVFERADWQEVSDIASYTACVYGSSGDEPGLVKIILESANKFGIKVYRWAEVDDAGVISVGPITTNVNQAIQEGKDYAEELDEFIDVDEIIEKIVKTGYFGNANADDIRAICKVATEHSQGYLLLPAGQFCGYPIARMWTTNGYLEHEHIVLDATYPKIEYAAHALLQAVLRKMSKSNQVED